jgi:hypothetical protein
MAFSIKQLIDALWGEDQDFDASICDTNDGTNFKD